MTIHDWRDIAMKKVLAHNFMTPDSVTHACLIPHIVCESCQYGRLKDPDDVFQAVFPQHTAGYLHVQYKKNSIRLTELSLAKLMASFP
jgi:hypothetical protein